MPDHPTLACRLATHPPAGALAAEVTATIVAIAGATIVLSGLIANGPLAGGLGDTQGTNADGDAQKALDVVAHTIIVEALRGCPVGHIASEESDEVLVMGPDRPLAVAIDPLDGSSNIDTNMSVGTIFSIRTAGAAADQPLGPFASSGAAQLAAGFVVYGPQTALLMTTGAGVDLYVLDRKPGAYRLVSAGVTIPQDKREYAINASNYRHWDQPVRQYIDDCLAGAEGPGGRDFNMRWIGSLVAEVYRILTRGGIFLYPSDARPGYREGRLRLLYEAQPIAFLVEQAGGGASNGYGRILDLVPERLHQRVPLILGSADKVAQVEALYSRLPLARSSEPLFGQRGLFRS